MSPAFYIKLFVINVATIFGADGAANFAAEMFAIDPCLDVLRLADIIVIQQVRIFVVFAMKAVMVVFAFGLGCCG